MHIKSGLHNSIAMFSLNNLISLAGFELRSSVPEAHAMPLLHAAIRAEFTMYLSEILNDHSYLLKTKIEKKSAFVCTPPTCVSSTTSLPDLSWHLVPKAEKCTK
jgi:hypothetical protein